MTVDPRRRVIALFAGLGGWDQRRWCIEISSMPGRDTADPITQSILAAT